MTTGVAQPQPVNLDGRARLVKPIDVGNGLLAGSFAGDGSWLSVGRPHPSHGFVELSGLPAFDERWRGDARAVRRYRGWMTEPWSGFLRLDLPEEASGRHDGLDHGFEGFDAAGRPGWSRTGTGWQCATTAFAVTDRPIVIQRHRLRCQRGRGLPVILRFSGHLHRCAFAEITEVDPPPPAPARSETRLDGASVRLNAAGLPAAARVDITTRPELPGSWASGPDGVRLTFDAPAGQEDLEVDVVVSLMVDGAAAPGGRPLAEQRVPGQAERWPGGPVSDRVLDLITWGATRYVLDCTAFTVGEGERALLTDHRLLPLSWTRDAYYQALLLLSHVPGNQRAGQVVAEHLRWLWGPGRPESGVWLRSHLSDGRAKDFAVQADQQLYPLLELLDYRRALGAWPAPPGSPRGSDNPSAKWGALLADAWRRLPRDGPDGLLVGEENPADDPSELPLALSTQILYWHTAARLAVWAGELGIDRRELDAVADTLPGLVHRHFRCAGPYGEQWAYESDGGSGRRLYQDANDLPTGFAPLLGFCAPDDPRWLATMCYAFSEHNPAHVRGEHGGLGSAHTPGTWTLGDAQELAVARMLRDGRRAGAVLARLRRVVAPDGLLPEAYCPDTGEWAARHWFAWPAATLGALHLGGIGHARQA